MIFNFQIQVFPYSQTKRRLRKLLPTVLPTLRSHHLNSFAKIIFNRCESKSSLIIFLPNIRFLDIKMTNLLFYYSGTRWHYRSARNGRVPKAQCKAIAPGREVRLITREGTTQVEFFYRTSRFCRKRCHFNWKFCRKRCDCTWKVDECTWTIRWRSKTTRGKFEGVAADQSC